MSAVGIILQPTLPQAPSAGQTFTVTFDQGPAWTSQDISTKPLFYAVQFRITEITGKPLSSSTLLPGIANLGNNNILPWDNAGEFILPTNDTLCSSTSPSSIEPGSFSYTWDSSTWKASQYRLAVKQATYRSESMFTGSAAPAEGAGQDGSEGQILCANAPFAMTTVENSYPFTLTAQNVSFVAGAQGNGSNASSGVRVTTSLLPLCALCFFSATVALYLL